MIAKDARASRKFLIIEENNLIVTICIQKLSHQHESIDAIERLPN